MKKQLLMTAVLAGGLFLSNHALGDPTVGTASPSGLGAGVFGEWSGGGSVDGTTGSFKHSIPIELPSGRGGLAPSLALTYDSSAGDREAGYAWGLDLPTIERRPMSGFPSFDDSTDRFSYSGSPLVYLCTVPACPGTGEPFPTWATGWRYYRLQHEGAFLRFFLDPSGYLWHVQTKTGVRMQFGGLVGASYVAAEFETLHPSQKPSRWLLAEISDDKVGASHPNRVLLGWSSLGAVAPLRDPRRYLEHIWDTPSVASPDTLADYAHHTQLSWEPEPHRRTRYAEADKARPTMRLTRIAVASKSWLGAGARAVERIYRLGYYDPRTTWAGGATQGPLFGHSFLKSVQMEGRCPGLVEAAGSVPTSASCAQSLPPITLDYEPFTTGNYLGMERELHPSVYVNAYESLHVLDLDGDGLPDVVSGWAEEAWSTPGGVAASLALPTFHVNRTSTSVTAAFDKTECVHVGWATQDGTPAGMNQGRPPGLLSSSHGATSFSGVGDAFGVWRLPAAYGENAASAFLQPERSALAPLTDPTRWLPGHAPFCPTGATGDASWKLNAHRGDQFGNWGWAKLTTGSGAWFVDVDGDGIVDQIDDSGPPYPHVGILNPGVVAFSRKVGGGTAARLEMFQTGSAPPSSVPAKNGPGGTHAFYADANGDGLVDLVVHNPNRFLGFRVYAGNGRGNFGCAAAAEPGAVCSQESFTPGSEEYSPPMIGLAMDWEPTGSSALFAANNDTIIHDVTGDGLADLVQVERGNGTGNVRVWVNLDGRNLRCVDLANGCVVARLITPGGGGAPGGYATIPKGVTSFGDVDGNGVDDIIVVGHKDNGMIAAWPISVVRPATPLSRGSNVARAPRPGLLTKIHNGRGAVTQVNYGTIQELDLAERAGPRIWSPDPGESAQHAAENLGWATHSPVVTAVVSDVSTTLEPTYSPSANFQISRAAHYRYRNPAFDVWERRFLGFRRVRVAHEGTSAVTESWYSFSSCARSGLAEPGSGAEVMAACSATSDDEPRGGRLMQVDHYIPGGGFQEPTSWLWSRHFNHARDVLFSEATPNQYRRVAFDYVTDTFTRYFDPAQPVALQPDGLVPFAGATGNSLWDAGPKLPNQGGAATTFEKRNYDQHGNLIMTHAVGRIDGDAPVYVGHDVQLLVSYTYDSACLPTFECRLIHVEAQGYEPDGSNYLGTYSAVPPALRSYHYHYEDASHPSWPTRVTADVDTGTDMYGVRHHDLGWSWAHAPPTQTAGGVVQLASFVRDGFGNIVRTEGPPGLGICTDVEFDPAYAQYPATINRYVHGCGTDALMENVIWDRGFGVPTTRIAADGGHTVTTLDAFGRPVAVERPLPDGAAGATIKTDSYAYRDTGPVMWTKHAVHPIAGVLELTGNEYALTNAVGETVAHMRTGDATAGREWIVDHAVTLDALGAVASSAWSGFTSTHPETVASTTSLGFTTPGPLGTVERDGFHRVVKVRRNGQEIRRTTYGMFEARSQDLAQLTAGPHQGKWTLTKLDGHGRPIVTQQAVGGDVITTSVELSPLGEPVRIHRSHTGADGPPPYTRILMYDTLGRVKGGIEPNTGSFYYAWDDAGRMVATADERGCGKNMFYDGLSRVTVEDFSPCQSHHDALTEYDPLVNNVDAAEVRYLYDTYEAGQVQPEPGFADDYGLARGKLVAAYDRGAKTQYNYDVRGRVRRVSRQIAKPGPSAPAIADRYTTHAFVRRAVYDNVDRVYGQETGADVAGLLAPDGMSVVAFPFTMRGTLQGITSSYGPLVASQVIAADGNPESMSLGDLAHTSATWEYDSFRRNTRYAASRVAPAEWLGSPSYPAPPSGTTQLHLADFSFEYNTAQGDLPVWVRDNSPPGEWTTRSRPVHRQFGYDDLYRVTSVNYTYQGGTGVQEMPLAAEIAASDPAPAPSADTDRRVLTQTFAYDWQGNTKQTEDDRGQRYDRSLGVITNDPARPNQLLSASGVAAVHDAAGNLVDLRVERTGACMVGGASKCSQRYSYEYDEVGQLTRARRWDYAGSTIPATEPVYPDVPASAAAADLRFTYHMDQRVLKSATVGGAERHTVEVFDSLRLNHAAYDSVANDYERTVDTEAVYLAGVGRLVYAPSLPTLAGKPLHVFLQLGDHLGSTSMVIDAETSELVERTTYLPHGATESDYRPARWASFREDYRFTGKEEDIEVGLTYFGGRYLHPRLGRWMSADPLTIHSLGADLNPYAYVHGQLSTAVDPWGLEEERTIVFADDHITGQRPPKADSPPARDPGARAPSELFAGGLDVQPGPAGPPGPRIPLGAIVEKAAEQAPKVMRTIARAAINKPGVAAPAAAAPAAAPAAGAAVRVPHVVVGLIIAAEVVYIEHTRYKIHQEWDTDAFLQRGRFSSPNLLGGAADTLPAAGHSPNTAASPGPPVPAGAGGSDAGADGGKTRVTGDALATARREFDAVKPRFWKNEAATNPEAWSAENITLMKQGKAPIGSDGFPMELHHKTPLAEGGGNTFDNLSPLTRTAHRLGPNYKINHPNLP